MSKSYSGETACTCGEYTRARGEVPAILTSMHRVVRTVGILRPP